MSIPEYTFTQIIEMCEELYEALFPAMLFAFQMHEMAVLGMILTSAEYVHLLLSIDNLTEDEAGQG